MDKITYWLFNKSSGLFTLFLFILLFSIFLVSIIPELFFYGWLILPLIILFYFLNDNLIKNSIIITIGNYVSYWIMGNSVKVSFGEKNIRGFSYNDYDVEVGRYDEINTIYEFYINDTFWSFVYDWYGTVLLLLSGLVILIIKKFNDLRSVVEKKEDDDN